jgi:hypothetical protein
MRSDGAELRVVCVDGDRTEEEAATMTSPRGLGVVVALGPRSDGRAYNEEDRGLADAIARQVSAMCDAREIYRRLDDHGRMAQQIAGLEYGAQCERSEGTGGDLFDLLPQDNDELVLAVGKVEARGVPAGILMGEVLGMLRALAHRREPLEGIVGDLNRALWELAPEGRYTSLLVGRVEPRSRQLRYVNAGHEAALLLRGRTRRVERLDPTGAVLGLSRRNGHRERVVLFEPGDLVAAFTEGVAEATGPDGVERILREAEGCGVQELASQVLAAGRGAADRTVVLVRFNAAQAAPVLLDRAAAIAAA